MPPPRLLLAHGSQSRSTTPSTSLPRSWGPACEGLSPFSSPLPQEGEAWTSPTGHAPRGAPQGEAGLLTQEEDSARVHSTNQLPTIFNFLGFHFLLQSQAEA